MKVKTVNFIKRHYSLLLSFWLPFLIMSGYFISRNMYPFGSSSLLTVDLGQQYVDFYAFFRNTLLHHPTSFFYSFSKALGGGMLGEWAYYLLSPFNLLLLLFPAKNINAAIFLMTVLKYGCAGLSFAFFIQATQKLRGLKVVMLSVSYALMGWFVAYQLNLLWLDAAILLPLICYFLNQLLLKQRYQLGYPLTLAAALIINYYTGYMISIFLILYCGWLISSHYESLSKLRRQIIAFAGNSILGGGLAAIILVPTFYSLIGSKGQYTQQLIHYKFEYFPPKMLAKLISGSFNFQQMPSGLPNIFIGSLGLIGFLTYFFLRQIAWKEKIASLIITLFLLLSLCFEPLDLFWHGMQFPVWYPYRFSFIVSFWMLLLAGRALTELKTATHWKTAAGFSLLLYAGIIVYVFFNLKKLSFISSNNLIMSAVFAGLIWLLLFWPTDFKYQPAKILLLSIAVIVEVSVNAVLSLNNLSYLSEKEYAQPSAALTKDATWIHNHDKNLFRTGQVYSRTKNDGLAHDLNTGSYFSSALEKNMPDFYGMLGNPDGDNYVTYSNGTVISDALLGMKYFITPKTNLSGNQQQPLTQLTEKPDLKNYHSVATSNLTETYQNDQSLPLAYLASNQLTTMKTFYDDPTNFQTNWLKSAVGHQNDQYFVPQNFNEVVFQNVSQRLRLTDTIFKKKNLAKESKIIFKFVPTTNNSYYLTLGAPLDSDNVTFYLGNRQLNQYSTFRHTVIVNLASHAKGQEIVLTAVFKKSSLWLNHFVLYQMNNQLVDRRLAQLKKQQPVVKKLSESKLSVTYNQKKSQQLVATTIPYNVGWHAQVNGKSVKIIKIQKMFLALKTKGLGHKKIILTYRPPYLLTGLLISLISLVILFSYYWYRKKHRKMRQ